MRTARAWPRGTWPRRELRAVSMRFSLLEDAAFCLARAGILTAAQAKAAHRKIERAHDRAFKAALKAAGEKKSSRRAHNLHKPTTD